MLFSVFRAQNKTKKSYQNYFFFKPNQNNKQKQHNKKHLSEPNPAIDDSLFLKSSKSHEQLKLFALCCLTDMPRKALRSLLYPPGKLPQMGGGCSIFSSLYYSWVFLTSSNCYSGISKNRDFPVVSGLSPNWKIIFKKSRAAHCPPVTASMI